ncbi:Glycosyl transferase family 2 [Desulfatibacillum alkenivorans DSM 16219]|jgi:glycosyltransferase involved in cell wall biosynthesis|uniref:Glycosyl transferase family 2 n=1 Tax=Desulfatibacillum alkenivorans DSM 16219 TaxID=1121393 RepID=A0A1M6M818_9BACT|nr:glycosyltransferase family 2 protein [Desulfatibacillum alkenivorans]SHJ79574.1 Glycosyl transferase family 2 [Desulfatibacillum alkenivorans DSM 16219]
MPKHDQKTAFFRVIAIIPAFNEQKNIAQVIRGIQTHAPFAQPLVVDDGSKDGTADSARRAGARVIRLPFNLGYGAALQTGFKFALANGYDYAVQIDGDGQHDPQSLPILLKPVQKGEADVVLGSRFLGEGAYSMPALRYAGVMVFRVLVSLLIRKKITDPTSGFQALNRAAMERFYASPHYPADFPDADVIIMLHRAGLRVLEAPVIMHPNPDGRSMHKGMTPVYYVFKMFLSIFLALIRKNPF